MLSCCSLIPASAALHVGSGPISCGADADVYARPLNFPTPSQRPRERGTAQLLDDHTTAPNNFLISHRHQRHLNSLALSNAITQTMEYVVWFSLQALLV